MDNFKIIVLIILGAGAVLGVFVFAGIIDLSGKAVNSGPTGTVVLWGTAPSSIMTPLIRQVNKNNSFSVRYIRKSSENYDQDLLEAFARGQGPDLFLLPDDLAFKYLDKISLIPYTTYPLINFKTDFASAAEVFLHPSGIIAIPLTIDPLMLYYNSDILDSYNVAYPPTYWDELPEYRNIFVKKNEDEQITQSAFALGQFSNISHAKDILTTMFMQIGNPIVHTEHSFYRATLSSINAITENNEIVPLFDFYLNFSNPLDENYSWNRSFPDSIDAFTGDKLVFYFGFASDLSLLNKKNPNQDLRVVSVPQQRDLNTKVTAGRVTGITMSRFSQGKAAVPAALFALTSSNIAFQYSKSSLIPPARRALLSKTQTGLYNPVFYSSALFAQSWLDPSRANTDRIFKDMIEQVLSNNISSNISISMANSRINILLSR